MKLRGKGEYFGKNMNKISRFEQKIAEKYKIKNFVSWCEVSILTKFYVFLVNFSAQNAYFPAQIAYFLGFLHENIQPCWEARLAAPTLGGSQS